ncbi:ATP-binding protein [Variovorax sp. J31P207]|uniref:ATP-binding protein n=1 Tax=Variovorax sp. J31P207 TaxID=3053510 RepID=UPI00257769CA|nr:ATP-binding protein [Variovorax sp. J31P207]MDM0071129.1 ATP-binding protein [Variovorax sp. J31P207]
MNAGATPLQSNELALGAALAWLRDRLQRLADRSGPAAAVDADELVAVPTLAVLSQRLGLSAFERKVLLLCVAAALDTRIGGLCAQALDEPSRPWPSFALAMVLFDDPAWEALSPDRPLRYWRLVEVHASGATPLTMSALRADDRIVDYIKGLNRADERIAPSLLPIDTDDLQALPPSQQSAVDALLAFVRRSADEGSAPALQLTGIDVASKQLVAAHVAAGLGLRLERVGLSALPAQGADLEAWCRLWRRECLLMPLALYIDAHDVPAGESSDASAAVLGRLLDRLHALAFVATRDAHALGAGGRDGLLVTAIERPSATEQTQAWLDLLGESREALASRLASQFNFNLPQIASMARSAGRAAGDDGDSGDDSLASALWTACRQCAHSKMDLLSQRIRPKAEWGDIVLPAEALSLLHQIVAQVALRRRVYGDWGFERKMSRGLGLSALFHGESGTGKTMAAEVIANALALDLYRIDLSAVISKYIGETEKNLQRIFDAAEDGGGILFFDEADALFGKRSEVRDSHDRYANIETNYLLQRIEAFRGLAILATNLKGSLDAAFMRRLRFVVPFTYPGPHERALMWQRAFPADTPVEGLDPAQLARLDCTGGSIHSIALNAAFLAAHRGGSVTMALVHEAARSELLKLGRPIHEADFRPAAVQGAHA